MGHPTMQENDTAKLTPTVFMDRFINIAWIFGKKYKEYEDF